MIPSLFFCADIQHSHDLAAVLRHHGPKIYPISGRTLKTDCDRLNRQFIEGEIDGLTSCQKFSEAADYPPAMGAFMARPTQSGLWYRQAVGRVLRPFPPPQGPRQYQDDALDAVLRDLQAGLLDLLLVLPTGMGKTVVACRFPEIIARWKGNRARGRIMFLVHMDTLADQSLEKFRRWNSQLSVGLEKARDYAGDTDIVIGSVQTLGADTDRSRQRLTSFNPDQFDMVVTDESHHAVSQQYHGIFRHFRCFKQIPTERDTGIAHLGLTATPDRADNLGLEYVYSKITYSYDIRDAIHGGWLVPIVAYRAETHTDISGVKNRGGDFITSQLQGAINTPARNEMIAEKYLEVCGKEGMAAMSSIGQFRKPHAVLVDFADNTSKHHLIMAPSLFGLSPKFDAKGKALLEQAEEVESQERNNPGLNLRSCESIEAVRASLKRVDILTVAPTPPEVQRATKLSWLKDSPGSYHLGCMDHSMLFVTENTLGRWDVYQYRDGKRNFVVSSATLPNAVQLAECLIPAQDKAALKTTAHWLSDPPSEAQATRIWQLDYRVRREFDSTRKYFSHCKQQFDSGNEAYTKGGLSRQINRLNLKRL